MHHLQKNKVTTNSINSLSWEPHQVELYAQIQAFAIDHPGASFSFSQRLARDHQWSLIYTQRVIEEYKKFLFLAMVSGHSVTPSNAVDEAWHLHLTYTHSYWDDLCTRILPKPLHHHPTQGGQRQGELFWDCYSKTLDSYERFFGDCAPVDIWPAPVIRFQQSGQFRQVTSQDYWVIRKPGFAQFQRGFWKIFHQPWLRNGIIALLTMGLIFSLSFSYPSAIAASGDLMNIVITQPAVTQVSSPSRSAVPTDSEVKPVQDSSWIGWTIGKWIGIVIGLFITLGFIGDWLSSWCPVCKRHWLVETTTHVLRKPTKHEEGQQLVTKRCKCCEYREEWREILPRPSEPDSSGCGAGCACI